MGIVVNFIYERGDKVEVNYGTYKGLTGEVLEIKYTSAGKRYKTNIKHGKWFDEKELNLVERGEIKC